MTEAEWLACQQRPLGMFDKISPRTSPRKLQLVAAGVCRLLADYATEKMLRTGVETLEGYCDEIISEAEYIEVRDRVYRRATGLEACSRSQLTGFSAIRFAMSHLGRSSARGALRHVLFRAEISAVAGQVRVAQAATRLAICNILREIVGNPYRPYLAVPSWQGGGVIQPDGRTVMFTDAVKGIADAVHVTGDFGRLPILADALEEAGVTDEALLAHCRDGGPHLRGCWALDVVRGRA